MFGERMKRMNALNDVGRRSGWRSKINVQG